MADHSRFLERLLNSPDLARVVPHLPPDVLLRVIERCGLDDCVAIVALARPGQLARVLDDDLWHVGSPGADDALDVERFGAWIEVLMEAGADVAARTVAALDVDLMAAGIARHASVFDPIAVCELTTLDGERLQHRALAGERTAEIGGYVVEARRASAWDAIVGLIEQLSSDHGAYFRRLMHRCVRLSNGGFEADASHPVLGERDQQMYDVAAAREARRGLEGYVAPGDALAFLQNARELRLVGDRPSPDPLWRAYRRDLDAARSPHAQRRPADASDARGPYSPPSIEGAELRLQPKAGGTIEVLREAGVLAPNSRALVGASDVEALRHVSAYVAAHPESGEDLAFLANVILAGSRVQGRALTPREAADAAAATCNLGLECWPRTWGPPDLVTAFRAGWGVLHRDVSMRAAEALLAALAEITCSDRDLQLGLLALERTLARHVGDRAPWRAQASLDAILALDAPAWAVLTGMMGSCPVLHAALAAGDPIVRRIDPSRFEFVSRDEQLAAAWEFLSSLRARLVG